MPTAGNIVTDIPADGGTGDGKGQDTLIMPAASSEIVMLEIRVTGINPVTLGFNGPAKDTGVPLNPADYPYRFLYTGNNPKRNTVPQGPIYAYSELGSQVSLVRVFADRGS